MKSKNDDMKSKPLSLSPEHQVFVDTFEMMRLYMAYILSGNYKQPLGFEEFKNVIEAYRKGTNR